MELHHPSSPFVTLQELPETLRAVAEVIGNDLALKLVDELPRRRERRGYERVVLYVPTKFKDGNKLAPIIGEDMARKMVAQFGGELIFLAHAKSLRAQQRLDAIANAVRGGMTREGVARVFGVSHSTVKRALRTSVAIPAPVIAFDHAPNTNTAH